MTVLVREIEALYTSALRDFVASPTEATLQRAYELGRKALDEGLGVVEMAGLHQEALAQVQGKTRGAEQSAALTKTAGNFLMESLGPFEMAYRGFRDRNTTLRRVNDALEEQAKRIAHALHDEAGQLLASAHIALTELSRELPERFQEITLLLNMIEETLRNISHELRPTILDDLGLVPALEFLASQVSRRTGLAVSIQSTVEGRLRASLETPLYRVHQEALNNTAKHARASCVSFQIERDPQEIRCSIRDDGIGFDVSRVMNTPGERGLGLIGMRERVEALGGVFEIISSPGNGTELAITIPLERAEDAHSGSFGR